MMSIVTNWLASAPDFAVPYALAALGLIVCERAGVLALGAEGLMLVGALAGVGAQLALGNSALSLLAAGLAAGVVSILFATMVIVLRINQVISGLALVFFCQGLTSLLGTAFGWENRTFAGLGALALRQNAMVYLTLPVFFAVAFVLSHSGLGLRLRAVGENPQAADAAGISVLRYRFAAVLAGSAIAGIAGGYLSVVSTKLWVDSMTAGRGWIAVALVIFARWSPWRALAGAVLFGCIEALIPQLAAAGVRLPQYFVFMTPYAITLAVMIWAGLAASKGKLGGGGEPGALGEPYVREERR